MSQSGAIVSLELAIDALAVPGVNVGWRVISEGDENALLPGEELSAASIAKVRRASGAGRIAARALMTRLGYSAQPVFRAPSGAPRWPKGLVGSIAHDETVAVAALASSADFSGLGIDIEPAETLAPELLDFIALPDERARIEDDPLRGRVLFAAKEAVYKAVHPLDGIFLEHHDVEIDLANLRAVVRTGRTLPLKFVISEHVVALAWIC
jgi:4'-phosphopantetheinyl transferase EntD